MNYRRRIFAISGAVVASMSAVAGCGADIPASQLSAHEAAEYANSVMYRGHSVESGVGPQWSQNAAEALPDDVDRNNRAADLVLLGHVEDVEPIAAFTAGADDAGGTEVDFNSPEALWREVRLRFAVEEVIAGEAPSQEISATYPVDGAVNVADFVAGIESLPSAVYYLVRNGEKTSDFRISRDGALVLTVSDSGVLDAPFLTPQDADIFIDETETLAELEQRAD